MARIFSRFLLITIVLFIFTGCQKRQFLPLTANKVSSNQNTPTPVVIALPITNNPPSVNSSPTTSPAAERQTSTPTGVSRVMLPFQAKSAGKSEIKWELVSRALHGSKENGRFLMDLRYPAIQGSSDALLDNLTEEIQNWINAETESFLVNVQQAIPETWNGFLVSAYSIPSSPSWSIGENIGNFQSTQPGFTGAETVFDGGEPVISILFETMEYFGGAHPLKQHTAINYDLLTGRTLALAELFQPGVDYLAAIANLSKAELHQRSNLYSPKIEVGAAPLIENFTDWNITPLGLLIIFEEEQVGPYLVGSQSVLIPYEQLSNMFSPQGPLRKWAK
jgi:hypothetical protein